MSVDPLDAILQLAFEEGALTREKLPEFARALRERAERVLEERVAGVEERAANLEREIAWRKEGLQSLEAAIGSLEAEVSWRRNAIQALESQIAHLQRENAWRKDNEQALRAEAEGLRSLRDEAGVAHDRLLEHHRTLLRDLAAQLQDLGQSRLRDLVRLRRQVREIAARLSGGIS